MMQNGFIAIRFLLHFVVETKHGKDLTYNNNIRLDVFMITNNDQGSSVYDIQYLFRSK